MRHIMIWNKDATTEAKNRSPRRQLRLAMLLLLVPWLSPQETQARVETGALPALCESAALRASRESGVPLSVLRAISLNETGRKRNGAMVPWPWTVNMEGKGKWFDTQDQARAYVYKHYKTGARSFDVGCFQINFKWHGKAFNSIEEMFDPLANARYAAKFLQQLFDETGDWNDAAGAYHSRTKKYADKYKKRFRAHRATLEKLPPLEVAAAKPPEPAQAAKVANRYPLLQGRIGGSTLGSLVPLAPGARRLIDASSGQGLIGQ